MKDKVYLVVSGEGVQRMTKRPPSLYREEVAISISVSVPDAAFRPSMVAVNLDVPEDRVIQPTADVEVLPLPHPHQDGEA